jgi:hypothetical protein
MSNRSEAIAESFVRGRADWGYGAEAELTALIAPLERDYELLRDAVLKLRAEVNCRIEHGAESGGHLEYVQRILDGVLKDDTNEHAYNNAFDAVKALPRLALDFLSDYEVVCRKHGMVASAYGWDVMANAVRIASPESVTEHIEDLKNEAVLPE